MLRELRERFLLWITLLLVVFSCEMAHARSATIDYQDCLGTYDDWRAPDRVRPRVKKVLCDFLRDYPEYTFIRHSDWRPLMSVGDVDHDQGVARSQHSYGRALDFRLDSYQGMTRIERLTTFQEQSEEFNFWLVLNGHECGGLGEYPQSHNPFLHYDTYGLDLGEKCGRRWGRLSGKYVDIDLARDWLESQL